MMMGLRLPLINRVQFGVQAASRSSNLVGPVCQTVSSPVGLRVGRIDLERVRLAIPLSHATLNVGLSKFENRSISGSYSFL